MERRNLILLSVVILCIFAYLFRRADHAVDTATSRAAQRTQRVADSGSGITGRSNAIGQTAATTSGDLPPVANQITNAQAVKRDLLRDIQTIEANLTSRREALLQQSAAIDGLRTSMDAEAIDRQQNSNADSENPQTLLLAHGEQVQQLTADLEEMRATREAIRRQEEEAIVVRENAHQLQIAQIDAQLQTLEEAQANTRRRLEQWAADRAPVNGLAPPNEELETLFNQQEQQIATLRDQRLALTTDLHVQADSIYNLSQQARSELRSEEQTVRSQIFSLQNEIRRIQQSQVQARRSEQSRTSQLKQAQQNLAKEEQAVRELESSLQSKRNELRQLQ